MARVVLLLAGAALLKSASCYDKKWLHGHQGSDAGLYNLGLYEGDIVLPPQADRGADSDSALLWPYGAIPFKPDDNIGCPDSPQCEMLMRAMQHYHDVSCVRFKEWTGEKDYVHVFFNQDSGACWSPVGRSGDGVQQLSLGLRCWYPGIVVHELGHAAGFWHEMNRPDRDHWIYVYWDNIMPGLESAFPINEDRSVNFFGDKFDYKSIMMYDEYAFSKDGMSPTLQAKKKGVVIGPIWKKKGLSAIDISRLHKLYRCDGNKPKQGFPYDAKCSFDENVCGFRNGGAAKWKWRSANTTGTDGYLLFSRKTAGDRPGKLLSASMHPASKSSGQFGALGCARFWYLLHGEGGASLKLSQAYLRKATQRLVDPSTTYPLWQNDTVTGEWTHVELPLYVTKSFKLIFTSQFDGATTRGTIALDDVELLYAPCSFSTTTISSVSVPGGAGVAPAWHSTAAEY